MAGITITRKRFLLFIADLIIFPLSLYLAYIFRFDGNIPMAFFVQFKRTILIFLGIRIVVNVFFGLYKGLWRYLGIHDFITIFKSITMASVIIVAVLTYLSKYSQPFQDYMGMNHPRSIYVIEWLITLLLVGGTRSFVRIYREVHIKRSTELKELLIVGAGNAGEMLVRDIQRNPQTGYLPIGFVDDDSELVGERIHNVKILGKVKEIPEIVNRYNIKEIMIAVPSVGSKEMREIVKYCQESGCIYKTMPGINDVANGRVTIKQIRNVEIDDLLGREKINLDIPAISSYLAGKVVMITGAGGSIGSELAKQVLKFEPKSLLLIDNNENSIYFLDLEFNPYRAQFPIQTIVEDITNEDQMRIIIRKYKPQVIFHAAAHKHVHLMERFPEKAIRNNVLGTLNMCQLSVEAGVEKFILISTDKAVNPTSVMGATKRIAELVIQGMNGHDMTKFMCVRFGNVLGSSGSVIPLFKRQIAQGGPVTVTDPEVNRYFMTIPEAVQLVIQAGAIGEHGNIFVLDMGEPVKIVDLAKELIRLSGLKDGEDIEIVFTSLRPGEKMEEELFSKTEGVSLTKYKKIFMARNTRVEIKKITKNIMELENIAKTENREKLMAKIKEIISEYHVN
ncbi:MAG: nucleoside-diphosphate sugar epimerase/dehydratase [bacterium]|nr:nucleoside-diphosphate sugar epimerase/dehydratase [bacterium]